jgi:hypothetical protein
MSIIDDGGPAFPQYVKDGYGVLRNISEYHVDTGITMLDYFAGKAMQGDWATQSRENGEILDQITDKWFEQRADLYYRAAKAMFKARSKP